MRFHVVGLPHTEPQDPSYSWCAYTGKVRRFAEMMESRGHSVETYAGSEYSDHVGEDIDGHWSPQDPWWFDMNSRVHAALKEKAEPGDFLALIMGLDQKVLADSHPELTPVEFGIGYQGVFAPYRVFESYAWMHTIYGSQNPGPAAMCSPGQAYDTVIPNGYWPKEFPAGDGVGDYLLYMGRLTPMKGLAIVKMLAERSGLPVHVAGGGDASLIPRGATYHGVVGPDERAELLGGARAVLVPTQYVEPFGGIHAEALMSGTPVITSDWGAFTETVSNGVDGFRCRTEKDYLTAVESVAGLDRRLIRRRAHARFGCKKIAERYESYFEDILDRKV